MNDAINQAQGSPASDGGQVLVVRVDELLVCIDLEAVERTFSLVELQPVPGSAHWVAGIMNYAGSSLAVVDLALRLGLKSHSYHIETPIVVCSWQSRRIGLIVSDIMCLQSPSDADVQLVDAFQNRGAAFRASLHTALGLTFLLDMDWLVCADLYEQKNFEPEPDQLADGAGVARDE